MTRLFLVRDPDKKPEYLLSIDAPTVSAVNAIREKYSRAEPTTPGLHPGLATMTDNGEQALLIGPNE